MLPINAIEEGVVHEGFVASLLITAQPLGRIQYL
jgi:hypothetical protein